MALSPEQFASFIPERWSQSLPPRPGSVPVPEGHARLFHYTTPDAEQSIREGGLQLSHAKGDTYGEPNMIWAAAKTSESAPRYVYDLAQSGRPVAEFSAHSGPFREGGELDIGSGSDPKLLEDRSSHVTLLDSQVPKERLVMHTPVDSQARSIQDAGYSREEIAGYLPTYAANPSLDKSGITPKSIMYHLGVTGPEIPEKATG